MLDSIEQAQREDGGASQAETALLARLKTTRKWGRIGAWQGVSAMIGRTFKRD